MDTFQLALFSRFYLAVSEMREEQKKCNRDKTRDPREMRRRQQVVDELLKDIQAQVQFPLFELESAETSSNLDV